MKDLNTRNSLIKYLKSLNNFVDVLEVLNEKDTLKEKLKIFRNGIADIMLNDDYSNSIYLMKEIYGINAQPETLQILSYGVELNMFNKNEIYLISERIREDLKNISSRMN